MFTTKLQTTVKQITTLILIVLLPISLVAQIKPRRSLKDSVDFFGKYRGVVKDVWRWKEQQNDHFLILSTTHESVSTAKVAAFSEDSCSPCYDRWLYAYHYKGKDSLLWQVRDFVKACDFDNILEFRNGATSITDLDKNGLAEVWVMYSFACTSDVSPRTLKLIMYEGSYKATIRGTSQPAKTMMDHKYGGRMNPDSFYKRLPNTTQNFGFELWELFLFDMID